MMQRSIGRRAVNRHDEDDDVDDASSFASRLTDAALDNPAMSGGLIVMALTALAIVSNATLLQNGHHPDPWFMTRPAATQHAPSVPVPLPRPRVAQEAPPLPRAAPAPAAATSAPVAAPVVSADRTLVRELQRGLASRGFYKGPVDGISGSRTRSAISTYETASGLPVTGAPTQMVLNHIKAAPDAIVAASPETATAPQAIAPAAPTIATIAAAPMPAPAATAPAPAEMQAAPAAVAAAPLAATPDASNVSETPLAAIAAQPDAPVQPAAAMPAPQAATPAPLAVQQEAAAPAASAAALSDAERERYREVQDALNLIGYGPVPNDGSVDTRTADAISRFELDNGLAITGKPDDKVIERLVAIGAMKAT